MRKTRVTSPRVQLWVGGLLVLAGSLILVSTGYQQIYWQVLHPVPSGWHEHSDRIYSGVLSATNQSVVVPIEGFNPPFWGRLRLVHISTNDTPITLTVRDWNNTVILQLPNCTGTGEYGETSLELYAGLAHSGSPSSPTLTITRETGDVTFSIRIIVEGLVIIDGGPGPFLLFLLGYGFGLAAIFSGFAIIEGVLRDVRRGRL